MSLEFLHIIELNPQPPAEFCDGDVAAITNGEQWAVGRSALDRRGAGAWPPDNDPGFEAPYRKGDTLPGGSVVRVSLKRQQDMNGGELFAWGNPKNKNKGAERMDRGKWYWFIWYK